MAARGKYAKVFVKAYRLQREGLGDDDLPEVLDIRREDLEEAARELGITIGNMPDLPYSLRSRQGLPQEVLDDGYTSLEIIGKSLYRLHQGAPTLEELLAALPPVEEERVPDGTPEEIKRFIGEDEQDILAVVRYSGLLDRFLGTDAYHWKSHWRTTGRLAVGFFEKVTETTASKIAEETAQYTRPQVEVDDMYVASCRTPGREARALPTIVPVEAKAPRETFSPTQILPILRALQSKFPGAPIRPVLLHHEGGGRMLLVEFNGTARKPAQLRAIRVRRYTIHPNPAAW